MKKILTLMAMAFVTLGAWADANDIYGYVEGTSGAYVEARIIDSENHTAALKELKNIGNVTSVTLPTKFTYNSQEYTLTQVGYDFDSWQQHIKFSSGWDDTEITTQVTKIVIPNGVKTIAKSAFYNYTHITSLTFPSTSLTSIGQDAFNGCTGLTTVNIPASVKSIGDYAFKNCVNLTTLTLNEGLESIGIEAFQWCHNYLAAIVIPSTVTEIGNKAFYYCDNLKSIEFKKNPTRFGDYVFGKSDSSAEFWTGTTIYAPFSEIKGVMTNLNSYAGDPTYKLTTVTLNEGDDIASLLPTKNLELKSAGITVNRTLHKGYWNTICLPAYVSFENLETIFGSGWKLAEFNGCTDNMMTFNSVHYITQNTPYLLFVPGTKGETMTSFTIDYDWISNDNNFNVAKGDYHMIGNLNGVEKKVPSGALFIANDKVYKSTGNSPMKAMSAYFTVPSVDARSFTFSVDGETTGIISIDMDGNVNVDENVYDLQGRRVIQPKHGLYIVNGKKVVR